MALVEPDDVLDKMVYGLTNPAKDSLVRKAKKWTFIRPPGFENFTQHEFAQHLSERIATVEKENNLGGGF